MANDDNVNALSYIINLIQEQQEAANKVNDSFVQEVVKGFSGIKDVSKMTNQEMNTKTKEIIDHFKSLNLATTQLVNEIKNSNKTLQEFKKETKTPVSTDTFSLVMTELLGRAHKQSEHSIATHTGTPIIDYEKGKGKKATLTRTSLKDLIDSSLDEATDKLIAFFERGEVEKKGEEKKEKRKFIHNFIDELAKSPLIKGTFSDTMKLLAYVAGSWLSKHFETFGRGVAIALIAAVPAIANILGKAIGDVIKNVLSGKFLEIFTKGKGVARGAGAARGLTAVRGLGVASTALGAWFGFEGADSWKKGHKGQGALLGGSGVAAIVGGIGLLFGAAFAPVTAALGVIVGLVTLAIKHWDKIKESVAKIAELFGIRLAERKESPYRNLTLGEKFTANITSGMEKGLYDKVHRQGGVYQEDVLKSQMTEYKLNYRNQISNTGEMLQGRAFEEFGRFEREYPKQFSQNYLRVRKGDPLSKYVNFSQFTTDVAGKYENGIPTEVILPRAVTEEYIAQLEYARKENPSTFTERVGLITGGIATAGSERLDSSGRRSFISPHRRGSRHFGVGGSFAIDAGLSNPETAELVKIISTAVSSGVPEAAFFGVAKHTPEGDHSHVESMATSKEIVPIRSEDQIKGTNKEPQYTKAPYEVPQERVDENGTSGTNGPRGTSGSWLEKGTPKVKSDTIGYQPNDLFSKCLSGIQAASVFGFTDSMRTT